MQAHHGLGGEDGLRFIKKLMRDNGGGLDVGALRLGDLNIDEAITEWKIDVRSKAEAAEREKEKKDDFLFFRKHLLEPKLFNFAFRDEGADPVFMHPRGLALRLYDNQKRFLTWASDQEKKRGGGIVADDTETGKTLEAISLVLDGRERDGVTCTLIVCQPHSVGHWIRELNRSLVPGNSKVFVYCEANREQKDLSEYDFVVTTYNVVEEEYRKSIIFKVSCHVCGERVHLAKLKRHAKICVKGEKSCGRKISEERTTVLHSIEWNRVILDEANAMAYRKSFGNSIFALKSRYHWAFTSVYSVDKLHKLVPFLRIAPFSSKFCNDCDCRQESDGSCLCYHHPRIHFLWWKRYVSRPITRYENFAPSWNPNWSSRRATLAKFLFEEKYLKEILRYRSSLAIRDQGSVNKTRSKHIAVSFEDNYYESQLRKVRAILMSSIQDGSFLDHYGDIFGLLTLLRQALDHPLLVSSSSENKNADPERTVSRTVSLEKHKRVDTGLLGLLETIKLEERIKLSGCCGLCHQPAEDSVVTSCEHSFCKACLISFFMSLGRIACPSCFCKNLSFDCTTKVHTASNSLHPTDLEASPKIVALIQQISLMEPSAKAIVLSQFPPFLEIIKCTLEKSQICCVLIQGRMNLEEREAAVKKFKEDKVCNILLLSTTIGGCALDLGRQVSQYFIMEPSWNTSFESQAHDMVDRHYRADITFVRFFTRDTVEEKILILQKKKERIFELAAEAEEKKAVLTVEDMIFLFSSGLTEDDSTFLFS